MTEQEAFLILNALGLSNRETLKLCTHVGSARKMLSLNIEDIRALTGWPEPKLQKIHEFDKDKFLKNEYNLLLKNKVKVLTINEEEFPSNLKEIPDCPIVLYYQGELDFESAIALVGSRQASFYGLSIAEKLAMDLASYGLTIVSGLARGIDTAAHRGAIKVHGKTAAVLGCGLSYVYPTQNKELLENILETGGVVLAEFAMGVPPLAYNFPRRNRIISGLSLGVVVIEAGQQSGALITSEFALEQGREVFAVPGRIDQPQALGTNRLIQQGARLVNSVEDILEELEIPLQASFPSNPIGVLFQKNKDVLSEVEQRLYGFIQTQPVSLEEILTHGQGNLPEVMHTLTGLEMKRYIKQLPGKYFVRN